jgi:hypothetical protein
MDESHGPVLADGLVVEDVDLLRGRIVAVLIAVRNAYLLEADQGNYSAVSGPLCELVGRSPMTSPASAAKSP